MKGPETGPFENHAYGRWFTYSTIALIITIIGGTILKSKLTMIGILGFIAPGCKYLWACLCSCCICSRQILTAQLL